MRFKIVENLSFKDAARLAQTCHHFQNVIEEICKMIIQEIETTPNLETCFIQKCQKINALNAKNPSFFKTLFEIHRYLKNPFRIINLESGSEQPTKILPTSVLLNFTAFQDAYKTYLLTLEQIKGDPQELRVEAQRDIRLFPQLPLQTMLTQENLNTETEEFFMLQDESDAFENEASKGKSQGCCNIM